MTFQEAYDLLYEDVVVCRLGWKGRTRIYREDGQHIFMISKRGVQKFWHPLLSDFWETDWEVYSDTLAYNCDIDDVWEDL